MKLLKRGNRKIAPNCAVWALPTSICKTICPGCYAYRAERSYAIIHEAARQRRLAAAKAPDFATRIIDELARMRRSEERRVGKECRL